MTNTTGGGHQSPPRYDAVIIGAGFAGLCMLYKLRQLKMTAHAYEIADEVGGTWYWNAYPGARCDIESVLYSFSFSREIEQEWNWTERFASQPEILSYLRYVSDRLELRRDISFKTRVIGATFDSGAGQWMVETDTGKRIAAQYLITAVGCLSDFHAPKIPGLDGFKGEVLFTGNWPRRFVSFSNKRVGVLGTGSSAIQLIPSVAREAAHLNVFQRTPSYSLPLQNRPLVPDEMAAVKKNYRTLRELNRRGLVHGTGDISLLPQKRLPLRERLVDMERAKRDALLEERWNSGGFLGLFKFPEFISTSEAEANRFVVEFISSKIRAIVLDQAVANTLCPEYAFCSKRPCWDTDYYKTFNRDNVNLVDVSKDPIRELADRSVVLESGRRVAVDTFIFATGFDAITGPILKLNLTGVDGRRLSDYWAEGPQSYLGLAIAGFPNLFTITGPLSPSALTNVVVAIEQHVDWIGSCMEYMRTHKFTRIEADPEAEARWRRFVINVGAETLVAHADAWHVGSNIPGKQRGLLVFTGGMSQYRELCDRIQTNGYEGFVMSAARREAA